MGRATRVLLLSFAYEPGIGGIESVSLTLARSLREHGYDLRVVTVVPGPSTDSHGVPVLRAPSPMRLVRALRWADVVLQSNVSLALAWPLLLRLVRRPWIVVNHTSIAPPDGRRRLLDRIKQRSLPSGATFAVSQFLAKEIPRTVGVLPNPYDEEAFPPAVEGTVRSRAILFVGRLARAKGVDVLIDALAELPGETAVVIGDGPERAELERYARERGVTERIRFDGAASADAVGRAMRSHRVLVVPSRAEPPEALGVVAIEALASGCVTVVSDQGGLPEAVGDAGIVVPPEDPLALAESLAVALRDDRRAADLLAKAPSHVDGYRIAHVTERYAEEIERVRGGVRTLRESDAK